MGRTIGDADARSGWDGTVSTIVLVGFMGSGKSTVGRELAGRLAWEYVDADDEIEALAGLSIPRIFEERGEAEFRRLERLATAPLLGRAHCVVSTGGGWPAHHGPLGDLPGHVLSIWLRVSPEEAVRRAAAARGARPLLDVPDPVGRAAELLEAREASYREATLHIDTEARSPGEVSERILAALGGRLDPRTPRGP